MKSSRGAEEVVDPLDIIDRTTNNNLDAWLAPEQRGSSRWAKTASFNHGSAVDSPKANAELSPLRRPLVQRLFALHSIRRGDHQAQEEHEQLSCEASPMLSNEGHSDVICWMVSRSRTSPRHDNASRSILPSPRETVFSYSPYSPPSTRKPHGRAWKVLDKERLLKEVVPQYYVCSKLESFTRQ